MKNKPHFRGKKPRAKTSRLLMLNKPFNTLCQFKGETGDSTLADYIAVKDVYPAGRLDKDSEGLLLLTNDGKLQHKISHPKHKMEKTYWVQVEGESTQQSINSLSQGVELKDGKTRPAKVRVLDLDNEVLQLWQRNPPIRFRQNIPTHWLEIKISQGKNRQVRRMTAAVGLPTLRLIRVAIGPWHLGELQPGEFKEIESGSIR